MIITLYFKSPYEYSNNSKMSLTLASCLEPFSIDKKFGDIYYRDLASGGWERHLGPALNFNELEDFFKNTAHRYYHFETRHSCLRYGKQGIEQGAVKVESEVYSCIPLDKKASEEHNRLQISNLRDFIRVIFDTAAPFTEHLKDKDDPNTQSYNRAVAANNKQLLNLIKSLGKQLKPHRLGVWIDEAGSPFAYNFHICYYASAQDVIDDLELMRQQLSGETHERWSIDLNFLPDLHRYRTDEMRSALREFFIDFRDNPPVVNEFMVNHFVDSNPKYCERLEEGFLIYSDKDYPLNGLNDFFYKSITDFARANPHLLDVN